MVLPARLVLSTAVSTNRVAKIYTTEVLLLASTPDDGTLAYAEDVDLFYFRANEAWEKRITEVSGAQSSGVLTGGVVTINTDTTKFDVSAGTGAIINWVDPANPTYTKVTWSALSAQAVPNIAAHETYLAIDSTGTIVKQSGTPFTAAQRRSLIELETLHQGASVIERIVHANVPAYETIAAIADVLRTLPPVNYGNVFAPDGVALLMSKNAGTLTGLWLNRTLDPQNPCVKTDAALPTVTDMDSSYQDGAGGFTSGPIAAVDPDYYDDGSGTLAALGANKWTIQQLNWSIDSKVVITYGQKVYNNLAAAKADLLLEGKVVDPELRGVSAHTTWLIVESGATDLSNPATAEFVATSFV